MIDQPEKIYKGLQLMDIFKNQKQQISCKKNIDEPQEEIQRGTWIPGHLRNSPDNWWSRFKKMFDQTRKKIQRTSTHVHPQKSKAMIQLKKELIWTSRSNTRRDLNSWTPSKFTDKWWSSFKKMFDQSENQKQQITCKKNWDGP